MRVRALLLLAVYWLAIHYLVFHTPFQVFPAPDVPAIQQMEYRVLHSAEDFPGALNQEGWHAVQLPDDWYVSAHDGTDLWYRATVEIDDFGNELWGFYIPAVTHNAAVYLNGTWAGQGGHFNDPVSRHHNEPLLFRFSPDLLVRGENTIDVRVKTQIAEQGLLGEMYLAPYDQLVDAYRWKKFLRFDFILGVSVTMLLMGLVIMAFWLARPRDYKYGIFSLILLVWTTHNLNLFIEDIPVPASVWEAFTRLSLGWTVIGMLMFNHRYVGKINHRAEKIALGIGFLGFGMLLLPDVSWVLLIGHKVWDSLLVILGVYTIVYLVERYWKTQNSDVYLMMLAGVPILSFGLHDILVVNHLLPRQEGLIIQYSAIAPAALFSWFLLRSFVRSVDRAEQLAATLEQRVQDKQRQLQLQYEQLGAMQRQQVLAEERERIMRDMHDGIGGQLVSLITLLQEQSGEVFKRIRERLQFSLTDLRMVIDSLDPMLNDLPTLLGMLRMRFNDQLEAAGIDLHWAVTELPEISNMSPRRSLHIMRIVQEAMTNAVKHSGTKRIKLSTGIDKQADRVFIEVTDFGGGDANFDTESNSGGRGIKNMQYRAQQVAGDLQLINTPSGVTVRLLLDVA